MARRRNRKSKSENSPELTGRRETEYKIDWGDAPKRSQKQKVKSLRDRISRAYARLEILTRENDRKTAYDYILGRKKKTGKKVYLNHLLPILEERHRQTIPRIPVPDLEGTSESSDLLSETAESLLGTFFTAPSTDITPVLNELQWDDDTFENGIAKIVWNIKYDKADQTITTDTDLLAIQTERALAENDDPLSAAITEGDMDAVHIAVHQEALTQGAPEAISAMQTHVQEHESRAITVKKEWPAIERVQGNRFLYDPDVPWAERGWEAELRSVRVKDLFEAGYKNVNLNNCPSEMLPEPGLVHYEDLTARVWYFHDTREEKLYVFSADGPEEGYLLHQGPWPYGNIDIYFPYVTRPAVPGFARGISTAAQCLGIIEELAEIDHKIQRHVKMHADYKTIFPKGTASNATVQTFNDPNARAVYVSPEALAGMKEYKPPEIPGTLLDRRNMLLDDLRAIAGVDRQDTGAPMPHQISATESARRTTQGESRKADRQKAMGQLLAWASISCLLLYKKFATQGIMVRVVTDQGTSYEPLRPEDIPEDLEAFIDVEGESEIGRADRVAAFRGFSEFLMASQEPTNVRKLAEDYGKLVGIKRPEKYRLQGVPAGPENVQNIPGQSAQSEVEEGGGGRILPFQNTLAS